MKVLIDSAARDAVLNVTSAASTNEKYNYTLNEETGQVRCMKLLHALVPRSFYAVVAGWSQRFEWDEASTARAVNLPEGTYDGATLATELSALVSAVTAGFTVTYDEYTNKLTFVNASGGNITIPDQITGLFAGTYPEPGVATVLGLSGSSGVISNGSSYTAPNMVDMSQPRFLFVSITAGSANSSKNVFDWYNRRQFMIPFGETPYLGFKDFNVNSEWPQCDLVDGQIFRRFLVEWKHGIANIDVTETGGGTLTRFYPLSFNGVPHSMTFLAE
jgi:hypothetical protein